jgi:hypothetical protein
MPSVYQIKFLPGGESRKFYGSEGDSYVLEDDNRIDVLSLPVWCHLCHDFSEGEMIEGLEEIDRQPADLRDPESELYRLTIDTFPTDDGCPRLRPLFTESLRQRRRWREARKTPPKCLICGSTEIIVFKLGEKARNPIGPGWVEITETGHCSTEFSNRSFTPEGELIPGDTVGTYWAPPGDRG